MKKFSSLTDPELIALLKDGAVGVLPTDTVYGLVCQASNQEAVKRLYALKTRERKPGTLIAANIDQLVELGLKYRYLKAVEQFWPEAISAIIPCGPELAWIHLGTYGIATRIPADAPLRTLLDKVGPLLTTSANHPGEQVADTVKEAEQYFKNTVDFYVDGGDLSGREASTIVRMVDDAIEVVRQGSVKISDSGRVTP